MRRLAIEIISHIGKGLGKEPFKMGKLYYLPLLIPHRSQIPYVKDGEKAYVLFVVARGCANKIDVRVRR